MEEVKNRLVLRADLKCGFKDLYIFEKGITINIDFIADKATYDKAKDVFKKFGLDPKIIPSPTKEEIYEWYKNDPINILHEFKIYDIVKERISDTCARGYFYGIDLTSEHNKGYPELFNLSNCRLEFITESEFKRLNLEGLKDDADHLDDLDFDPDFYDFDDMEEAKEPIDTTEFKEEDGEQVWKA